MLSYHLEISLFNKYVKDHACLVQNCTPGSATELSGIRVIKVHSSSQQMKESSCGHKRKNEKTEFMLRIEISCIL